MLTIELVLSLWPGTTAEEWRKEGEAWVHAKAAIEPSAALGANSTIGSGAKIGSYAKIGSDAKIGSGAKFLYSPLQIRGTKFLCYHAGPGLAGIGCQVHPIERWFSDGDDIARRHGQSFAALEAEYRPYMELIRQRDAQLFPPDKAEM